MRLVSLVVAAVLAGVATGCSTTDANPLDRERRAVEATLQLYLEGHATGRGAYFVKAFHPEAKLYWVKSGTLAQKTAAEFAASWSGKAADDEAKRTRRIASIDITGDAAMAKVELDYPSGRIVDYFALLKLDGKWRIVNKIFHRGAPRSALPSRK
jgi:hypothetical protein